MFKTYTLLAYRENSDESFRGHVSSRSNSFFEKHEFDNQDELIKMVAEYLAKDFKSGNEFASHELTILYDGRERPENHLTDCPDIFDSFDNNEGIMEQARALSTDVLVRQAKEKKEQEAKEAAIRTRQATIRVEMEERALLVKLSQKYANKDKYGNDI
jgi:hypothetical protein